MRFRLLLGRLLVASTCTCVALVANAQTLPRLNFAGSVTWIGQVPILVAIEKGFFREQGLDVQVQVIVNSADRIRAIAAGDAAFSNLGRVSVISEMARGNEAFSIFANVDDSPGQEGCWARPGIASVKDLKGKPVAANSSAEITLMGLLSESGMTLQDTDYRSLPGTEMAAALSHGDVQAACVWQPLLDRLKQAVPEGKLLGTDKDTAIYRDFGTMAAGDIVIISRKLAREDPATAKRIAAGVLKGADFTIANPGEAGAAVASYFRQTPEQVTAAIKGFQFFGSAGWPEHMRRHQAQIKYLTKLLHGAGKIPAAPDTDLWVDTSFVPGGK
ncbi:ABC-type nitrate/sulfonate/bicarbonate transport system, substrate-binding protein [Bosea sp. OK403]|uniref:ABC transporter substrate-binding protein n=1 Tax=Bosea sp. OK403 TaxID=1855286 RepID=UPI0008ED0082|nr:ABC transporter substrate-binding protein [Bosea sp. OK403]SFI50310.1 ABC-type nitrate/sulfonate/bicarbonate transport system, substrate-binding protein [Bosea sp. OK403]